MMAQSLRGSARETARVCLHMQTGMEGPMTTIQRSTMTRRTMLLALSATALMGQQTKPVMTTRRFNNVMIAVSDVNRSAAFYEQLFGPPVRDGDVAIFRVGGGPHFFGLTPVRAGAKPGYLSYGLTVEDFDAERVMRTLMSLGIGGAELTRRGDTLEIFVSDPN